MEPFEVEVVRGGTVEARHRVHAVAVATGEVVERAGDAELVAFVRSAAKPIQVLPLVREEVDLTAEEIAIASASHLARPEQLDAVRRLLVRAEAGEEDLACGAEPARVGHNCSGKHAAMLLLCRRRGWPRAGYHLAGHPCQQAMLDEVAAAAAVDSASVPTAVDGCGVLTFALSLARMATTFAHMRELDGGHRVAAAMQAFPELIRGPGAPDTELMRAVPGWIAKAGAEGVLCAASPDGLGIAVKVEDGAGRAVAPALAGFLERVGVELPGLRATPLVNSRGESVGEIRLATDNR